MIDLQQASDDTRSKIVAFINSMVDIGVAGFRVDAAKHMHPGDMESIQGGVSDLNSQWFPAGGKPFFYHEVIDQNSNGEITIWEYIHLGRLGSN